eukprot:SAG31_NODE_5688_length_2379_cov_3.068860_3_plen_182_part_00
MVAVANLKPEVLLIEWLDSCQQYQWCCWQNHPPLHNLDDASDVEAMVEAMNHLATEQPRRSAAYVGTHGPQTKLATGLTVHGPRKRDRLTRVTNARVAMVALRQQQPGLDAKLAAAGWVGYPDVQSYDNILAGTMLGHDFLWRVIEEFWDGKSIGIGTLGRLKYAGIYPTGIMTSFWTRYA